MKNAFFAALAGIAAVCFAQVSQAAAPTGTFSNSFCNGYPGSSAAFLFLLTDGTVLVHDQGGNLQNFYRLTPDNTGSYLCGTWTAVASIPNSFAYGPKYYGSAVLQDGRLLIMGGEYNPVQGGGQVETNKGAIYLPATNQWLPVRPPTGWTTIGDAQTVILQSGQLMLANCCSTQQALFNPNNLTWTPTGSQFAAGTNNESGWTLLPDGSVMAVLNNAGVGTQSAQRWIMGTSTLCPPPPKTTGTFVGTWCSAGTVGQELFDTQQEMGPQVLLNNGTVLAIGATGNVSVYTPPPVTSPASTQPGSWANTTKLPVSCGSTNPGPANLQCASTASSATVLPSGNVLLASCPVGVELPQPNFLPVSIFLNMTSYKIHRLGMNRPIRRR
jgi:hypothetical protein